ncbi:MAG TPA: cation diffusion facilitator family transporter [Polyangiaceae bacterium]|nr:cation diffusion facilitator family transporter [Polyangiaceae bacterium]
MAEARQARRLSVVIAIVGVFFVVELGGALLADSVVLQADALHLLMDVLALSLSLVAMRLAVSAPTTEFTYGLRRAEPVAAILGALLVLVTTGAIVVEGVKAFEEQTAPKAGLMLLVAVGAILVNGVSAWLLHDATHVAPRRVEGSSSLAGAAETSVALRHVDHDGHDGTQATGGHLHDHGVARRTHGHALNLRGAWLHLAGDTLGALGALAAAIFIRLGGTPRADPIASFIVAGILLVGSLRLVRDATMVLLEAAPRHLPLGVVRRLIAEFPGVREIRELHVWTLGAGHDAITVRVGAEDADFTLAERISLRLRQRLGVEYVTVQVDAASGTGGRR